jgi:hypothetical protein
MAAALQYLGHHANTRTQDTLRQAGELLPPPETAHQSFYPGAEMKKALITEDTVVAPELERGSGQGAGKKSGRDVECAARRRHRLV